jgi:hypothetical protein
MEAMIQEIIGPGVELTVSAEPPDEEG